MAHYTLRSDKIKATNFEFAIVGGLSISQALAISPIVSIFNKRMGMRPTMLIGAALIFLSLLTSSFVTQVWHLILSQGICFGWGMGFIYVTASAILPSWFSTHRSLAVGLATSGAGLGGLVYSLVANAAIESLGVEWAYRIIACCSLCANLLACALLKEFREGATMSTRQDDRWRQDARFFGQVEVVLILFWGFVTELGYIALLYSLPSFAASISLTPTQGSVANALLNLGLGLGRPPLGWLSDIMGRINMAMIMTALCALFCFSLWIPAQSFSVLLAFAFLAGATCGTFWCTVTPVLVEVVGLKKFAGTFSVVLVALVLPTTFAEVVAMEVAKASHGAQTRDYTGAQAFVGFMFLAGALSLLLLRCWKVWRVELDQQDRDERGQAASWGSRQWMPWLRPRFVFGLWRV